MQQITEQYYKRDFWAVENLKYSKPHFRMSKAARLLSRIANGRTCNLLDVGCGPATLATLLPENIRYYGIDIAIQRPAPNLSQADFVQGPIRFGERQNFDIIVAQGVFEYVGRFQEQKLEEIRALVKNDGVFLCSYVNFDHLHKFVYEPYSNVQSFDAFRSSLERAFYVRRCIPTSYHWHHHEPNREFMKKIQMHLNIDVPVLGRMFAVEYFFVCSPK